MRHAFHCADLSHLASSAKALAACAAGALNFLILQPAHADRMALWNIVHGQCVAHEQAGQGVAPCVDVDDGAGIALLKDLHGVAQELAIPTQRVTGIEDAAVLAPAASGYFPYAWKERAQLEAILKRPLPRESVGVSVNSMYSRSQDQLHLHVDCMDKGVAAALNGYADAFDEAFRPMTIALRGRVYWGRRLEEAALAQTTPFQMLAEGVAGAREQMGAWSLILVGETYKGKPDFVLLADHAELAGGGHAEDLQDHDCAIAPATP